MKSMEGGRGGEGTQREERKDHEPSSQTAQVSGMPVRRRSREAASRYTAFLRVVSHGVHFMKTQSQASPGISQANKVYPVETALLFCFNRFRTKPHCEINSCPLWFHSHRIPSGISVISRRVLLCDCGAQLPEGLFLLLL